MFTWTSSLGSFDQLSNDSQVPSCLDNTCCTGCLIMIGSCDDDKDNGDSDGDYDNGDEDGDDYGHACCNEEH